MIDISFKINGKKVRPDQMRGALEMAVCQEISENLKAKLRNIRDTQTGETPKIVVTGKSLDDLKLEISGSEDFIERVKKVL